MNIALFFILLFCEGFFSGSEIAIVSADPKYLQAKRARDALVYLEQPARFLAITLLGTNLSVVTNTALTAAFLIKQFGIIGELLSVFALPPILLIFGEVIPKTICRRYPNIIAPKVAFGLKVANILLFPFVSIFSTFTEKLLKLTGAKGLHKRPFFTREELKFLLQKNALEVSLTLKERQLLNRLFTFTETAVKKAMIPLVEVVSISEAATIKEALFLFSKYRYTRLPVFRDRVDNIIGIIHYCDFLNRSDLTSSIKPFIRNAFFVPETKFLHTLLKEMQRERQPLAVVVDEYGGAVGIVTIKDLLEVITGEMIDEDEKKLSFFEKLDENRYLIKGRMEIDEINEKLFLNLPKKDYETLNGFIISFLGRIPAKGEKFYYKNLTFVIKQANPRSVEEVEVIIGK